MSVPQIGPFTQLLLAWRSGQPHALDELAPLAYNELRRLAAHYLQDERPGHTLQPTALVHEAWLKLIGNDRIDWQCRSHFFAFAATLMRRILVDHARARSASKRGDGLALASLDEALSTFESNGVQIEAIDDALNTLAKLDPQQASIVELRVFAGLTVEETSEALGISPRTVKRDWASARAFLHQQLS
jgi:RNA polymerase sigma factor (TIGR02999 family)